MKRPFAVLGFTYLTALMVALFVGSNIAYILSGVLAVLFFYISCCQKTA